MVVNKCSSAPVTDNRLGKMDKFALLFPGQGTQYVGMGEDLYRDYPAARSIFEQANDILDFDLAKLCFRGPGEELDLTHNAQPAVLTTSMACLEVLTQRVPVGRCRWEAVAGHSLGEYTALIAAGSLKFTSALRLVRKRGQFMKEASEENPGGMMAVVGLNRDQVENICREIREFVRVANLNCPGQIVVSGERKALLEMEKRAKEEGARKTVNLSVSGPFHSFLMKSAAEKLAREMETIEFRTPEIPFLSNVQGDFLSGPSEIRESLLRQVDSPVLWENSMRKILEKGTKTFLEIGPGRVLTSLLRRIDKTVTVYNIGDGKSLGKTVDLVTRNP